MQPLPRLAPNAVSYIDHKSEEWETFFDVLLIKATSKSNTLVDDLFLTMTC